MIRWVVLLMLCLLAGCERPDDAALSNDLHFYVAASTAHVIEPLMIEYQKQTGIVVRVSAAGSAMLARQIEQGAGADVYLSANEKWMDYLGKAKLIDADTRRDLLGNRLVLVAPSKHHIPAAPIVLDILAKFEGRMAMGDPDTVPAGMYGKTALQTLKLWDAVESQIVPTKDVRSALLLVERGEVEFGLVYATDAASSQSVITAFTFPDNTHAPIRYPIALTRTALPPAKDLLKFLCGEQSRRAFEAAGFTFTGDGGDDAR